MDDYAKTAFVPASAPGPQSGAEHARLVVVEGANTGKSVLLDRAETCIGRRSDNHLVLDSRGVSRLHGKVVREGDQFYIEDLGATQGIIRNEETLVPKRRYVLAHGDRLRFADQIVLFCLTGGSGLRRRLDSIAIDSSKVRAEADEILEQFPELKRS